MNRAAQVLKDVQEACKTLENNLNEVERRHKQLQDIGYLEFSLNKKDDELMRIRKNVNKKIQEIESEIQVELQEKSKYLQKTEKKAKSSLSQRQRVLLHQKQFSSTENKTVTSHGAKHLHSNVFTSAVSNSKFKKTTEKNSMSKFSSKKVFDQFITQHLLGNQPQRVHLRSPSKSPVKVQQGGVLKLANNVINDSIPIKISCNKENFHPQLNLSLNPAFHNCLINDDVLGTAIPLARPNQDPKCRLSLFYEHHSDEKKIKTNDLKKVKGPNVAVINMRSDSFSEIEPLSNVKSRLKAKVRQKIRNKLKISVQNLPNIDIDSNLFSSSSSTSNITCITNNQSKDSNNENKEYDIKDDLSYHFQAYDHMKDNTKEKIVDDESEKFLNDDGFLISGCQQDKPKMENGPAFPPTHVQNQTLSNIPTLSSNQLKMHAQEWLEHELLSRIVQLNDKGIDPTLKEVADSIKVQSVFNEEEDNENPRDWIENIIGLKGLQMFVEAGVPIDSNLVDELIRSVLLDMLVAMYGHPPQFITENSKNFQTINSISTTPISTPIHTPTPTKSPVASTLTVLATPEKSISELSEQLIDNIEYFEEPVFPDTVNQNHSLVTIETPSSSICLTENEKNYVETPEASLCIPEELNHTHVDTPKQTLSSVESLMKQESLSISKSSLYENKDASFGSHLKSVTQREHVAPISPVSINETTSISTETPTTSVGISTFEGISVGELLNPSHSEIYDGVSEGELGFPLGVKISNLLHEYPEDLKEYSCDTKMILKKMIGSCHSKTIEKKESVSKMTDSSIGEYKEKSLGESFKDKSRNNNDYFEFDLSADPQKSAGEILYEMLIPPKNASNNIADGGKKIQLQPQIMHLDGMFKPTVKKNHIDSNNFLQYESTIRSEGEINSNVQDKYTKNVNSTDDITLIDDDLSQYELSS
ncbi:TALPID3 protein isoform X1 [Hydra vulgaris]|uniref:TALPID3 protein isoform X1 n=2 Tax=Hydra vulgaris TaxID=6087 RepID=UPI001F5FC38B|nr:TALPID3 protein isoform X1 [Hydra vulgaris]XP_047132087.1 TALPID3 protein isoform X1 [Hydra vulgaris]